MTEKFNRRKRALNLLKQQMGKDGFHLKKAIKNTIIFYNEETGQKIRKTLVY